MSTAHSSHYASVQKRVMAKLIDLVIVLFLGQLPLGSAGAVLGFLYSILADALSFSKAQGQSIGLLIGIPLFLIELSLMIRAERHQRLGDVMAESVVLDSE
jgi:hypothetical protein